VAKGALDPSASPDLLEKPRGASVRRLNRKPVIVGAILGALILLILVYVLSTRGPGQGSGTGEVEKGESAFKQAEELTAGQGNGVINGDKPVPAKASVPKVETAPGGQVEMADMPTPPPPPTPPSELEIELWQRRLNLMWERHARLQKSIEAATRIDFDTGDAARGAAPGGSEPGFDPALVQQALAATSPGATEGSAAPGGLPGAGGDPNKQAQKKAFLEQTRATGSLTHRRQPPESPYEIKTGSIIPAVMIGGINSDLPGVLIAQVSQHVWDTATGGHLLIPQGTRLYGTYDSEVAYGQKRVLVAWTRLIFPDASTLELEGMPGADQAGHGGFKDKVDRHLFRLFGSAVLLSIIGSAFEISQPSGDTENPTPQQQAAAQLAQELGAIAREQISRELDVQPTLVIRPGYRFNVMVTKDLTLEPYAHRRQAANK